MRLIWRPLENRFYRRAPDFPRQLLLVIQSKTIRNKLIYLAHTSAAICKHLTFSYCVYIRSVKWVIISIRYMLSAQQQKITDWQKFFGVFFVSCNIASPKNSIYFPSYAYMRDKNLSVLSIVLGVKPQKQLHSQRAFSLPLTGICSALVLDNESHFKVTRRIDHLISMLEGWARSSYCRSLDKRPATSGLLQSGWLKG